MSVPQNDWVAAEIQTAFILFFWLTELLWFSDFSGAHLGANNKQHILTGNPKCI